METLKLPNPLLVARSADTMIIAAGDYPMNHNTLAQLWTPGQGYSPVRNLQVHLKFMYYLEEVSPPEPWQEPT